MKKYIVAASLALFLVGCGGDTNPVNTRTEITGKYEDCTFYYTRPAGSASNFTWVRCKDEPKEIVVSTKEICGKGCIREVITRTIEESKK